MIMDFKISGADSIYYMHTEVLVSDGIESSRGEGWAGVVKGGVGRGGEDGGGGDEVCNSIQKCICIYWMR